MAKPAPRRVLLKRVNIDAPTAIRAIRPPILGRIDNVMMTPGDILKCLCKRAKVDEILPDGTKVRLNMSNYYLDNSSLATGIPTPPEPANAPVKEPEAPAKEPEAPQEAPEPEAEESAAETEAAEVEEEESIEDSVAEEEATDEEEEETPAEEDAPAEEEGPVSAVPTPQQPKSNRKQGRRRH